jgi:hypothetical protein
MKSVLVTVIETPDFIAATRKLMTDDERMALIDHLAENPLAGDLMPGTGGMRKLRWALEGRGKRGGARVIYYFHNEQIPLFALDAYAKNEKADLKPNDVVRLRRVVKAITDGVAKKGRP